MLMKCSKSLRIINDWKNWALGDHVTVGRVEGAIVAARTSVDQIQLGIKAIW